MDHRIELLSELSECKRLLASVEKSLTPGRPSALLVTGAGGREGKTLLAAALAVTAARGGRKVLALDLDWYRPGLAAHFGVSRDWALDAPGDAAALAVIVEGVDGLSLLGAPRAGGEAPDATPRGEALIRSTRESFELAIIDAPSVFPANRRMMDPVRLSALADAVLFVVRAGHTPGREARRAASLLAAATAAPVGLVVNHWGDPLRRADARA